MRRTAALIAAAVLVAVGLPALGSRSIVGATAVPVCVAATVRVTNYNVVVGAGSVNELVWIRNVGSRACSLRGYATVHFVGVYGVGAKDTRPHSLAVPERRSFGRVGNDLGGLMAGWPIPTVTLAPGAVASFWLYGTDEQHGTPATSRCIVSYTMIVRLPGSSTPIAVRASRVDGFYWCGPVTAHPIVPGASGSDPPEPLSHYFGARVAPVSGRGVGTPSIPSGPARV